MIVETFQCNYIPSSPEYQNWLDSSYNQTACNSDPEDLLLLQVAVEPLLRSALSETTSDFHFPTLLLRSLLKAKESPPRCNFAKIQASLLFPQG